MSAETISTTDEGKGRRIALNVISYGLLTFSMWASYLHWYALVRHDGQPKFDAVFIAGCVDLGVYVATLYRQRDSRIGRRHSWGICTFPNFALVLMICVSVAGNVAEAKHSFGGYAVAVIPSGTFLLALALAERDIAETARRRARQRAEARALIEEHEAEKRRLAEAERLREEARQEDERLAAERELKRLGRDRRHAELEAERLAGVSPSQAPSVSGNVSPGVSGGGLHVVPPPEAGANTPERLAMWAHWAHVIKTEQRLPSGAELNTAARCTSSIGRRMAARWREIEPAKSLLAREATGS
jgi:hypothetical protein